MDPNIVTAAAGVIGLIVGTMVAYRWGDIAAEKHRQVYEKEQRRLATIAALGTIQMEARRAQEYCRQNQALGAASAERYRLVPLPTRVFMSIFIDHYGEFEFNPDLMDAAIGYLADAERINAMIDLSRRAIGSSESTEHKKASEVATLALEWHTAACNRLAQIRSRANANRAFLQPDSAAEINKPS